jgi:ribosomal protein S18 acetylase RimI-like enzyme
MVSIRLANESDVNAIFDLIKELAIFEKAEFELINTPEQLLKDGFNDTPSFICIVAEDNQSIVGMSFLYVRYSTWKGRVLYLEDLIVKDNFRNKGIGTQLMNATIEFAKSNNYKRIQWQVLDWNTEAIRFYKKFNAQFDSEWINVHFNLV